MTESLNDDQTPRSYLKAVTLTYTAMLVAQVFFGAFVLYQKSSSDNTFQSADHVFIYVVPLVAIACFTASKLIFKMMVAKAKAQQSLKNILKVYQGALLVRLALLEGASFIGIVAYLLTGNVVLIAVSGLLVAYFLTLRPTKEQLLNDLDLSFHHKMQFDDEDKTLE